MNPLYSLQLALQASTHVQLRERRGLHVSHPGKDNQGDALSPSPSKLADAMLACCSSDGKCPCTCNYASDVGCTCRDLSQTINVTLVKTPVYNTYPLTYVQAFNYAPYEVRAAASGSAAGLSCSSKP